MHGYEVSGISRALRWGRSSWTQASVFSGLLAAMCHERCAPQRNLKRKSLINVGRLWLPLVSMVDGTLAAVTEL